MKNWLIFICLILAACCSDGPVKMCTGYVVEKQWSPARYMHLEEWKTVFNTRSGNYFIATDSDTYYRFQQGDSARIAYMLETCGNSKYYTFVSASKL